MGLMISQVRLYSCHFVDEFFFYGWYYKFSYFLAYIYLDQKNISSSQSFVTVSFSFSEGRPVMGFKDTMLICIYIYIHLLFP